MDLAARTNRRLLIGGSVVFAIALLVIVARAFVADALGGPMEALDAIPDEVSAVMIADLAEFRDIADNELIEYALRAAQETGSLPAGEPGVAMVEAIEESLGIDLERDVLSWVGRSAAVGIAGDLNDPEPTGVFGAIYVRNEDAAWDFLELVVSRTLEEVPSAVSGETTLGGHRVITLDSGEDNAHFTVRGDHMLMTDGLDSLRTSFATLAGDVPSVRDATWFKAADAELDGQAWVKMMIDPTFISSASNAVGDAFGPAAGPEIPDLVAFGTSFGLDGNEITMELFIEQAEPFEDMLVSPLPLSYLEELDSAPLAAFGVGLADDFGQTLVERITAEEPTALDDLTELSMQLLGVDIVTNGIAQMGGHVMVAVAADSPEVIDVLATTGLVDPSALVPALEELRSNLLADGVRVGGSDGYLVVEDSGFEFGVRDGGFSFRAVQGQPSGGPASSSSDLEWLESRFPDGVVLYVDLYDILLVAPDGPDQDLVDELEAMRLGVTFDAGDRSVRISGILEVDPRG